MGHSHGAFHRDTVIAHSPPLAVPSPPAPPHGFHSAPHLQRRLPPTTTAGALPENPWTTPAQLLPLPAGPSQSAPHHTLPLKLPACPHLPYSKCSPTPQGLSPLGPLSPLRATATQLPPSSTLHCPDLCRAHRGLPPRPGFCAFAHWTTGHQAGCAAGAALCPTLASVLLHPYLPVHPTVHHLPLHQGWGRCSFKERTQAHPPPGGLTTDGLPLFPAASPPGVPPPRGPHTRMAPVPPKALPTPDAPDPLQPACHSSLSTHPQLRAFVPPSVENAAPSLCSAQSSLLCPTLSRPSGHLSLSAPASPHHSSCLLSAYPFTKCIG